MTQIGNQRLDFFYDENDSVVAFKYNNAMYYYLKNAQGDIVSIVDSTGAKVAQYTYDAWGNILTVKDGNGVAVASSNKTHIANLNPFRYRGYYYDTESNIYYIQSRYYDPTLGRFISMDVVFYPSYNIKSGNLYVYCANEPVNNKDLFGTETWNAMAERHLYHNNNSWKKYKNSMVISNYFPIIDDQSKTSSMLYGAVLGKTVITFPFIMFSYKTQTKDFKSDYNGCGWIAIYNALFFLGKKVDPTSIIYWLEMNNGLLYGGMFGTSTNSITKYFKQRGYNVTQASMSPSKNNLKTLDAKIKNCTVAIICYMWNQPGKVGGHFVMVRWNKDLGMFIAYNAGDSGYYNSMSELSEKTIIRWLDIQYILIK